MKFSKEILEAVNALEIRSRRDVAALLSGQYRSAFRGSGMQFKEFRPYEPGDDVRHISWPITARTGHPTLKIYEEERELNVILAIDVSGSSLFGQGKHRKTDVYAELLALLGLAAVRSGDKCGVLFFHDKVESYLPPRRSEDHIRVALAHLLSQPLRGMGSDLNPALEFIGSTIKRRSLVMVLSDFNAKPFDTNCVFIGHRHDLVLLQIYDNQEKLLGIEGVYEVEDPETGECLLIDTSSTELKKAVGAYSTSFESHLESITKRSRADYLPISVQDDYLNKLLTFFRRRGPGRI